jgi:site-specific recombinase XerD
VTAKVLPIRRSKSPLAATVDRFLSTGDFTPTTRRVYRATLAALIDDLGAETDITGISTEAIEDHLRRRYGVAASSTFNRNRATLRSLFDWTRRKKLRNDNPVDPVDRRKQRTTEIERRRSQVLTYEALKRIWSASNVSIRERTFWNLLYDSAARAEEVLGLNVEDLDLDERRARILSKGADAQTIHWATGTARLLPRLIGDRTVGPVFLTDRRSRQPVALTDIDTETGRARLSYRRAAELFRAASGGRTLHEIRHASITHLVQGGVDIALVAAKSRHTTLRSLERYVHPTEDDVARLTASHDPEGRRRRR